MKNDKSLSTLLHEVNNVLTSLNLSIELLLREALGTLNSEQKKYLQSALSDGKEIKNLIKKVSRALENSN